MLPGDILTRDGCLAFLSASIPGFHVGSHTALAWRGVRHNLAFRERLMFWGNQQIKMPVWFTQRFECHYQVTELFNSSMPVNLGLQPLPGGHGNVLVSVPERALLELLSDVGKTQSLEDVRQLVENLRGIREPLLDELLLYTIRIKVVRLASQLADEYDLPWAALAHKHSERLGGGARWVSVTRSGERIDLKRK
jgi:hypothetical protein